MNWNAEAVLQGANSGHEPVIYPALTLPLGNVEQRVMAALLPSTTKDEKMGTAYNGRRVHAAFCVTYVKL